MSDVPGRSDYESDDRATPEEDDGWGSPVPAQYGSLHSLRPAPAPAPAPHDSGFAQPGRPEADASSAVGRPPADTPAAAAAPVPPASAGSIPPGAPRMVPGAVGEPTATQAGIDPAALAPAFAGTDALAGGRARRRRPGRMRTRATVRHVDIGSVLRVSAVFWLVILVALVLASLLLWLFADAFGVLPSLDKSIRTLFSLKSFQLRPGSVAMYTAAGGIVIAVAGMIGTLIFALIYNLIADVVGGFRVELESISAE